MAVIRVLHPLIASSLIILFQITSCTSDKTVKSAFASSGLFPDVVSSAPTKLLKVTFGKEIHIYLGTEITPAKATKKPVLDYPTKNDALYTVVMIDPDAPNSKGGESWLHWIVVNVPGHDIKKGEEIVAYAKPTPPQGTGIHRYVFLAYQQSRHLNQSPLRERGHFRLRDFLTANDIGEPWAGNYFRSQYMD